jgi:hypothetical protein
MMRPSAPDLSSPIPRPSAATGTEKFGWGRAWALGIAVSVGVVVATVLVPTWVAATPLVRDRTETVGGVLVATVWLVMLAAVMWALRRLQRQGRI